MNIVMFESIFVLFLIVILVGVINLFNNICDIEEDIKGGCCMLVILLGFKNVIRFLVVLFGIVYIWIVVLVVFFDISFWIFLVFFSVFKLI